MDFKDYNMKKSLEQRVYDALVVRPREHDIVKDEEQCLKIIRNVLNNEFELGLFDSYQEKSRETWITGDYSVDRAYYGLAEEVGEVLGKRKKSLRGDGKFNKKEMKDELGDVLYYLARVADTCGMSLSEIAKRNYNKLKDRKERGVLKGSGDNR